MFNTDRTLSFRWSEATEESREIRAFLHFIFLRKGQVGYYQSPLSTDFIF